MSFYRIRCFWIFGIYGLAGLSGCSRDKPDAAPPAPPKAAAPAAPTGAPTYSVEVVHRYPHDPTAFTEGLEWDDGTMYESTGIVGQSSIRRTDLATGTTLARVQLPAPHFGEGITVFHGTLYELTWTEGIGFRYDPKTLAKRGQFTYSGEGWGLTHDDRSLIMSDGTNVLRYIDPATFHVQRTLAVTADGLSVPRLNELERIHGEIWANVWQSTQIARIDPATGRVIAWIDVAPLVPQLDPRDTVDVANGIAYDSAADRIFVTGKLWPTLYQIKLGPAE
jgi:glutaminyl-peptide cyclotransferase